jgi:hypothetical protein
MVIVGKCVGGFGEGFYRQPGEVGSADVEQGQVRSGGQTGLRPEVRVEQWEGV